MFNLHCYHFVAKSSTLRALTDLRQHPFIHLMITDVILVMMMMLINIPISIELYGRNFRGAAHV